MATFPQGYSNISRRANAGERRVLNQLKRCLGDDYIVWHDVPIGPRARQPDFVLLHPRWGVLLIEVKDWKLGTLISVNRDSVELETARGHVTAQNPLRQARDYMIELVRIMESDAGLVHTDGPHAGKLRFPYGYCAAFSRLKRVDVANSGFCEAFPDHQVLMADDFAEAVTPEAFMERLWRAFTVHYPCTLTMPQRDRIRWHLFPEVRLSSQGSLDLDAAGGAPPLPDLMQVMDMQQEQVARTLGEGHRVIHGAAGSGKTMILVFRAVQLAAATRPERPILVLCFNRALADRIDRMLRDRGVDERVQVRSFHQWCSDMQRTYQLNLPRGLSNDEYFRALSSHVVRAVDQGRIPRGHYTAVMIDEAHDFEDDWLRIVGQMVSPETNSLLVLYDDAQSIYQKQRRAFNFARVGISAVGRTSVLRLNYRNTAEVLTLAMHCAQGLLAEETRPDDEMQRIQPISAGRRGPLPVLLEGRDQQEEVKLVSDRIAAALAAGVAADEIAVLARTKATLRGLEQPLRERGVRFASMSDQRPHEFDWELPSVKLLTLHSCKGLEFPHIYIAGLQSMQLRDDSAEDVLRLLYVGMTRATLDLVLSAHGTDAIVERVRTAIATVRQTLQ